MDELTRHTHQLTWWIDIAVVDGSSASLFAAHHRAWAPAARHIAPALTISANGKVRGTSSPGDKPGWTHPIWVIALWASVTMLGVAGVALFADGATAGAILFLFAIILAVPAFSASRHLEDEPPQQLGVSDDRDPSDREVPA